MTLLGVRLTLLIGPTVPVPAPPQVVEAFDRAEVTHDDENRSGFQLIFKAGRSGPAGTLDYPLLSNPLLRPFHRVILVVTFNVVPRVLIDGIITHQQLAPSNQPGESILTVTGEDVSVMMDLEEKSAEHPAQPEPLIALQLIGSYARFGLLPQIIPPTTIDPPIPIERVPVQQCTDLEYLRETARRFGYVFYIAPGPAPGTNTAYWGPPIRVGVPQRALTMNMGPETNVESLDFSYDGLAPELVEGKAQVPFLGGEVPIRTFASTRLPLSSQPAWLAQSQTRTRQMRESGLSLAQFFAHAQGRTDAAGDHVVGAEGELDASRYGDVLQARALVGVRGVGYSYDGLYYVQRVTHRIRVGEYKQSFSLRREGLGSTTPVVPP